MHLLRHSSVAGGIAVLVAAVVTVESWQLAETHLAARTAARSMTQKQHEMRRLAALTPAPTAAQAAEILGDLAEAEGKLAALETAAWNRETTARLLATAATGPVSRAEAFFVLAEFVRHMRELAGRSGVVVGTTEQFGFSAYSHAGPENDLAAPVLRQCRITGYLLEALFGSHIQRLVAVQRAPPAQIKSGIAGAEMKDSGDGRARADYLAIDQRFSIGEPDMIGAMAFRLTFVSDTAALRGFLNRLAAGGIPVVVRTVEVELVRETPSARRAAAGSADPLEMIVRPASSRFTVTLEFCEINQPPAELSGQSATPPPQSPAAAPRLWAEPTAQRRGRGWVYELFTPPALYYDRQTASVRALPATASAPADATDAEIELQLVEVRRAPFRLQLVGYAGDPGDLRGIFVQPGSSETLILRGGERIAAQGLRVEKIDLACPGTGAGDDATADVVARAIVQDEFAGEDVTLSNREPCLAGAPVGVFTSRKTPGFRRELREGESVGLNGWCYCVTHIDLQPAQVAIACLLPGATEPRNRILAATPTIPAVAQRFSRTAPAGDGATPTRVP